METNPETLAPKTPAKLSTKTIIIITVSIILFSGLITGIILYFLNKTSLPEEYAQTQEQEPELIITPDEEIDFTQTLKDLGLPETASLDEIYNKVKELDLLDDRIDEDLTLDSESSTESKVNFYVNKLFNDGEIEFPYSFFSDYSYHSASLIEKAVKDYFSLAYSEPNPNFIEGSLKDNSFTVSLNSGKFFKVNLDVSELDSEKEVTKITIYSNKNKLLFNYDGNNFVEENYFGLPDSEFSDVLK